MLTAKGVSALENILSQYLHGTQTAGCLQKLSWCKFPYKMWLQNSGCHVN